jgi:isoleucyl-tRNA synthetase
VDEWYISMGEVYDQPREALTADQVDRSLRYQIMEAVDQIRWIPGFGYERELDWLLNMHDWMISKKRYWGLALPIWSCADCGAFEVLGGRDELRARAVEGWERFEGHTPHRPHVDEVVIACRTCGGRARRILDVGNPWLDAGIVPFSTLHYREDPDFWANWFPADFITESFPGQFRNWFYAMLAMSTVLRREAPFKTIFGYATLFGEDGRPMHKSWGNAIEFDEAAERMGVDVMRWLYMSSRPDDNILFGWHAADEARRRLLVLWNVYAFFVTYARLTGWTPDAAGPPPAERSPMDRWILSRSAALAAAVEDRLRDYDAMTATRQVDAFIEDLSTWFLRLSRRRFSRGGGADRDAAFATLHAALVALTRTVAPILPFLSEDLYRNLVAESDPGAAHSVHLTRFPTAELALLRDERLEAAMAIARRAVDLARTLRGAAGLKVRQPLARLWLALPGGDLHELDALVALIADEVNVRAVELIGDESALVERRVKVLLPKVGKKLGPAIPAVMAAARDGAVEIRPDGSVAFAGIVLAPDEVEILATPRPGTAVAHDDGLVVVIDTELTPDLRAEGDARELQRAIQDLRKEAELDLDDEVDLRVDGLEPAVAALLDGVAAETLARLAPDLAGEDLARATIGLEAGPATILLRRRPGADGGSRRP